MSRFSNPQTRYTDDAGNPLVNGLMYFYETQTTTLADTYADSDQETLNSNPVELSGAGQIPNVFFTGTLKAVLRTSAGVLVFEKDPVTSGSGGSLVTDWDALITYSASDIVRYDSKYYISLVSNNINNTPDVSASQWATYPNGDITCDSVTATTFTGDLVGNATTATTADNSLSLGGNLASEYLPDAQSSTGTDVTITSGDNEELTTIDLGTVNAGSVLIVSGGFNVTSPVEGQIIETLSCSGTAVYNLNGEASGFVKSDAISYGIVAGTFIPSLFVDATCIIEVTTTGTLTVVLSGSYTGAAASTEDATGIKLATAYLIKKA